MQPTEIRVSAKVVKSKNYQSGSGEVEISGVLHSDDDLDVCYNELKSEALDMAEDLAVEALERARRA